MEAGGAASGQPPRAGTRWADGLTLSCRARGQRGRCSPDDEPGGNEDVSLPLWGPWCLERTRWGRRSSHPTLHHGPLVGARVHLHGLPILRPGNHHHATRMNWTQAEATAVKRQTGGSIPARRWGCGSGGAAPLPMAWSMSRRSTIESVNQQAAPTFTDINYDAATPSSPTPSIDAPRNPAVGGTLPKMVRRSRGVGSGHPSRVELEDCADRPGLEQNCQLHRDTDLHQERGA